ncbi:ArsR family transcriptional regulator [Stella humosa]|uniref:ArsR family transcriptional regulator n=1 Tax=Stella humosa TaxID=94 RepID=A0A3N1L229_9PROT|nr:helix-turn-helix domain-containing protein [Stella humosa]ROP84648.1 ArsR family transcriptional regulator [Stella humosa]BBK34168.1 hypothetical protein STHU_48020 [Stella humosa]
MNDPELHGEGVDAALAALADPVRRRVVDRLRHGPERAGDLARALALAPPAMSKHLRILRRHRLVEEVRVEDDARVKLYRLRPEPFRELGAWLEVVQAHWAGQLDAFKTHVERRMREEG